MLIGLISDTHVPEAMPNVWPQVYERFKGVDLILHGGDLHTLDVVDRLQEIAPIHVARGNGDDGGGGRPLVPADPRLRDAWALELGGLNVGMVHDLGLPERPPGWTVEAIMERHFGGPQDVVVHGHTHVASIERVRGCCWSTPAARSTRVIWRCGWGRSRFCGSTRDGRRRGWSNWMSGAAMWSPSNPATSRVACATVGCGARPYNERRSAEGRSSAEPGARRFARRGRWSRSSRPR